MFVTEDNQNDYYEDEHWYAEMPGIDSTDMVLHLEGVDFAAGGEYYYGPYGTVVSSGDLTIELEGENIINCPGNTANSDNAVVCCEGNLVINGSDQNEDIISISSSMTTGTDSMTNSALSVRRSLTLNNCKVYAYAPNCNSGYSFGVCVNEDLFVNHSYIEGISRNHSDSSDYSSIGIEAYTLNINGHDAYISGMSYATSGYGVRVCSRQNDLDLTEGTFISAGNTAAYEITGKTLVVDNYINPVIRTSDNKLFSSTEWDGSYPLSACKYISVTQGSYGVNVGGVDVTPFNASDILGDETAALVFDENKLPVLTLANADITGFSRTNNPLYYACIWSVKPLTVVFNGDCTVNCGSGEINEVPENRRYAIYNGNNDITIIANNGSTINLAGYSSLRSGADIDIQLSGNAVLNSNCTGTNISAGNFSLSGDGGYTFNAVNLGEGACISVPNTGRVSFVSDSTDAFSEVNLRHYCDDFSENASPVLATFNQIQVKNVFLTIRGFQPTTMVLPRFSTEYNNENTDNILITVARSADASFHYKWNNTQGLVDIEHQSCFDCVRVEPYYDTYQYADVNGDGLTDANDFMEIVNKALSGEATFAHRTAYDLNRDGCIDVLDCVLSERLSNNLPLQS